MAQVRVHIDFETFSEANLLKVGGAEYARHPSTKVLMAAWAAEDEPVQQWDATVDPKMPAQLREVLENRHCEYTPYAQNANFEIMVSLWTLSRTHDLDVPDTELQDYHVLRSWLSNWRCTMVMGMGLSLPGSLGDQGAILRVDENLLKLKDGKRLIRKFCLPNRSTKANPSGMWDSKNAPEDWALFLEYNRVDVEAERANYHKVQRFNSMPEVEWRMWHLDQLINLTGLAIDTDLVTSAMEIDANIQSILRLEFHKLTRLENPNSTAQLIPWLNGRGYPYDNLRKDTIEKFLNSVSDDSSDLVRAVKLRQATSKTSNKKYAVLANAASNGVLRGIFQYGGAQRTRRWAGRLFQPQNLPRGIFKTPEQMQAAIDLVKLRSPEIIANLYGTERVADVLSSLIRNCITAREGRILTVADLASIETVMTWWAAGATDQLDKNRRGIDAYKDYGVSLLGKPYDDITKPERTYCKPVVLGCCYRLGGPGLQNYAEAMGVKMTKKEAYRAVDVYREANPEVVALWSKLEFAFKQCLVTGEPQSVDGKFRFRLKKPCLFVDLPSGRSLCYVQPKIQNMKLTYEDRDTGKTISKITPTITYMGVDQFTRKWTRQSTHGGKLLENLIQAISRDILRDGMLALNHMEGYGDEFVTVGHVHDEIIMDTLDDPKYMKILQDAMTNSSPWCADAPLAASAFQSKFYMKD